jgi:hypothetical protein
VHVRIVSMQVQSVYQRFAQPLMQPLDVVIDIHLGLPIEVTMRAKWERRALNKQYLQVSITISEVNVVLTEKQYSLAIAIIRDNYLVVRKYQKINSDKYGDTTSGIRSNSEAPKPSDIVPPANVPFLNFYIYIIYILKES